MSGIDKMWDPYTCSTQR
ncbi:hypothetical protein LSH36_1012g00007 [Paralvinella palmiformis]|uniref:Uncharacterized protein n=1 Tax=Paralvinella palmiformis TaxID=53620 RepID=A0AAD9IWL8_9ANNE|nr:hypothetical protein LSH36_1012g00007 [Paralvinella palmiformis]